MRFLILFVLLIPVHGGAVEASPPRAFASDDWVSRGSHAWPEERARRQALLDGYLRENDPAASRAYGFRGWHTPALAWNWFSEHPIGYGGMPNVLLQTLLSLDPATEKDPHLRKLAAIWKKKSVVPDEAARELYTLDHLGFSPHPQDYADGVAKTPQERRHLPKGLAYDPGVHVPELAALRQRLQAMAAAPKLGLARGWLRKKVEELRTPDYERDRPGYQTAPAVDAVFFSCSACHVGRVIVGGRMQFLPGMPNTEIDAQYFSRLLMETGFALLESGFDIHSSGLPLSAKEKAALVPDVATVKALYVRLISRAVDADTVKTIHGPRAEDVARARTQTYRVARDFNAHVADLIQTAIKTQYVYYQVAAKHAFSAQNRLRADAAQPVPDVMANRIGQMDAFGIASGLVAIHSHRPSFLGFLCRDHSANPLFALLGTDPGPGCKRPELDRAAQVIRQTLAKWAPPVPAPVDIPSLSWTGHRVLANWDGNQGAAARVLASGTSATGDPLKVNVRIHEPLNPFIDNLPPPPWPYAVDREKARRGMAIFNGERITPDERCADCHRPHSDEVVPAKKLGVDVNRTLVNTDVSRYALAGLVMEACRIFMANNPGNDWCLPRDAKGMVIRDWARANDDYFKDTPGRVRAGANGYKVDMPHGIWARAPYLHNGSVPTLGHLFCPAARPKRFLRGVLFYDEAMVGFEWAVAPRSRYSAHDVQRVETYDTAVFSRSNAGHPFGSSLCPDLAGLDPVADRREIARRILASPLGDLIEYLKTL
jgi:hypothetical protein